MTAEPGREFAFEVGKGETSWSYLFEVIDGQTEVTERAEILKQPGAVSRLLTRLAVGVSWSQSMFVGGIVPAQETAAPPWSRRRR